MVNIRNAHLDVNINSTSGMVTLGVRCDVNFTDLEKCQMKECKAKWYKLRCAIRGKDDPDADDKLVTFRQIIYFDAPLPNPVTFRPVEVERGELNEDGWPRPQDEIYAKLTLSNLQTGNTISENSNRVDEYF